MDAGTVAPITGRDLVRVEEKFATALAAIKEVLAIREALTTRALEKAEVYSETVLGVIKNENPVADYLTQPTGAPKSKMFQRPIDTEVSLKLESFLPAAIEKALSKFEDQDLVINI